VGSTSVGYMNRGMCNTQGYCCLDGLEGRGCAALTLNPNPVGLATGPAGLAALCVCGGGGVAVQSNAGRTYVSWVHEQGNV
jgi:hypothetical protein